MPLLVERFLASALHALFSPVCVILRNFLGRSAGGRGVSARSYFAARAGAESDVTFGTAINGAARVMVPYVDGASVEVVAETLAVDAKPVAAGFTLEERSKGLIGGTKL